MGRPLRYTGEDTADLSTFDSRLEGTVTPNEIVEIPPPVAAKLLRHPMWHPVSRAEHEEE